MNGRVEFCCCCSGAVSGAPDALFDCNCVIEPGRSEVENDPGDVVCLFLGPSGREERKERTYDVVRIAFFRG